MMENKKLRAEHPKKELAVDILYDIIGSILFGAGIYTFVQRVETLRLEGFQVSH